MSAYWILPLVSNQTHETLPLFSEDSPLETIVGEPGTRKATSAPRLHDGMSMLAHYTAEGRTCAGVRSDMGEKTFGTRVASEKLKSISEWMPELEDQFTTGFCSFLGERLGDTEILPIGYIMAFTLAIADAKSGTDGFTGKPMSAKLTGQHPMIYHIVWTMKVAIARAVFGEEFAELVSAQVKLLEA